MGGLGGLAEFNDGASITSRAQTTEAEMAARLVGKPLMLRGTWADDKLTFDASGRPQGNYEIAPFSICGIDVTRVQISGDRARIEGQRMALQFYRKGVITRVGLPEGKLKDHKPEMIRIEIRGDGSKDFFGALDAVFADDLGAMVPQMPDFWQKYAKKHFLHASEVDPSSAQERTAAEPNLVATAKPMHVGGGVKPPRLLRQKEAEFSDAARRAKYSGNVLVYLVVDTDGLPTAISVMEPVGYGLDEAAVRAVSQYTFKPAMMATNR